MNKLAFEHVEKGVLSTGGVDVELASIAWNEHKDFPGVFLKTVVAAHQTNGHMTCHLVRIEPGAKIGLHTHETSLELHEVMAGQGLCLMGNREVRYVPGSMAVLERGMPHEVRAGEQGLWLFAKFVTIPA